MTSRAVLMQQYFLCLLLPFTLELVATDKKFHETAYSRILDARWAYFFTPILRVIQAIHS